MATEAELTNRLHEILSSSDLNTTTTTTVRKQLEEDFGIDLSDKKAFIRESIDNYLQSHVEEEEDGGGEEEEQKEDEVEEEEEEVDSGTRKRRSTAKKRLVFCCELEMDELVFV